MSSTMQTPLKKAYKPFKHMPESWIQTQNESLRKWLTETTCPMAVTLADGGFLWVNPAFERLLEFTLPELLPPNGVKWNDLTVKSSELAFDQALVEELLEENRQNYLLQKTYRKKSGETVDVIIQVIRYPSNGSLECFLVTVMPVEKANEYMASRIRIIERLLTEFIKEDRKSPMQKTFEWAQENKVPAAVIGIFIAFILFGPRVLDFAKEIKTLFFTN